MLKAIQYTAILVALLFFGCLAALMFFYSSSSATSEPSHQQQTEKHEIKNVDSEAGKSVWEKTTADPVAFFTLWLVVFTAVLSAVGVIQLKMLSRAETVAEKTARAAKDSAEAATKAANANVDALEISRAQIRAYFTCLLDAKLDTDKKQIVRYTCKNTGQSQARKVKVTIRFGHQDLAGGGGIFEIGSPMMKFVDDLGPNDTDTGTMISTETVPQDQLEQRVWAYRARCTINFEDIFGKPQIQEFEVWKPFNPKSDADTFVRLIRPPD